VFLDELTRHAEADCYDVVEVVTTDPITSTHIGAGDDLQCSCSMDESETAIRHAVVVKPLNSALKGHAMFLEMGQPLSVP